MYILSPQEQIFRVDVLFHQKWKQPLKTTRPLGLQKHHMSGLKPCDWRRDRYERWRAGDVIPQITDKRASPACPPAAEAVTTDSGNRHRLPTVFKMISVAQPALSPADRSAPHFKVSPGGRLKRPVVLLICLPVSLHLPPPPLHPTAEPWCQTHASIMRLKVSPIPGKPFLQAVPQSRKFRETPSFLQNYITHLRSPFRRHRPERLTRLLLLCPVCSGDQLCRATALEVLRVSTVPGSGMRKWDVMTSKKEFPWMEEVSSVQNPSIVL